jgi:peptidoglycan/xylan/chitin deacetylase (PgdA/CDA1 family)
MKKAWTMLVFIAMMVILFDLARVYGTPLETLMGTPYGEAVHVPIIMYHAIEDTPDNRWEITASEFESDLAYLSQNGYTTIFMQDLIDFVYRGQKLPENPIVLSFDDGRTPTIDIVLPLLEKYNARITMAIIGRFTDEYTEIVGGGTAYPYPHMTWGDVRDAVKTGRVEITSHTYDLHGTRGVGKKTGESYGDYKRRLEDDMEKFDKVLESNVDLETFVLVYPLGVYNDDSEKIFKEAGFLATLTCREKLAKPIVGNGESLFGMGRYLRPPHKTGEQFFKSILN